jgi:pimeloyl-ACP methyl ester carboxylesterase
VYFRFLIILLSISLCSCAHLVTISYQPDAEIHPAFNQRYANWQGERVEVELTPSLRGDPRKYLANYDRAYLADAIRQHGLHHEYRVAGTGTPLVVYARNPHLTEKEKHYPTTGITLSVTAVKERRPGQVPVLRIYDTYDPVVVRFWRSSHPIAANYTAVLAVLLAHAHKVASSVGSFLRADNPRFATGIYLVHPYNPKKIPVLFIHGLFSSPISWQNSSMISPLIQQFLNIISPGFFCIRRGNQY